MSTRPVESSTARSRLRASARRRRGELIARVNYFGSQALLDGLRPALAASGAAQVVQFGSNSSTTTPNLPDELIAAYLDGREDDALAIMGETVDEVFAPAVAYAGAKLAITRWCRRVPRSRSRGWARASGSTSSRPGPVDTPLLRSGPGRRGVRPAYGGVPGAGDRDARRRRPGSAWVEFLLSPVARFACGSVIYVDGGTDALMRANDWPRTFTT